MCVVFIFLLSFLAIGAMGLGLDGMLVISFLPYLSLSVILFILSLTRSLITPHAAVESSTSAHSEGLKESITSTPTPTRTQTKREK